MFRSSECGYASTNSMQKLLYESKQNITILSPDLRLG